MDRKSYKFYSFRADVLAWFGDGCEIDPHVALTSEEAKRIVDYIVQKGPDDADFSSATELDDLYVKAVEAAESEVEDLMREWVFNPDAEDDYEFSIHAYFPDALYKKAKSVIAAERRKKGSKRT